MVLSMDRWVGKVAVVTGASSGIGAAITESLVKEGIKVVGLARRKDRLDELAKKLSNKKGKLIPLKADISKEEDILNAFKWIRENVGPVHILINNAGISLPKSNTTEGETEAWRQTYEVNVIGLCIATREAVKDMKANKVDGHIIHINSLLGHHIHYFPGLSVYPSTKFAVTALAETLRLELLNQKSKIKITSLSPGLVATEFGGASGASFRKTEAYKEIVRNRRIIDAEDVANGAIYVLSTPPHVQIQELTIRAVADIF